MLEINSFRLSVGDGFRFGFGFGAGMFFWGFLITVIMIVGIFFVGNMIVKEFKNEFNSFLGIDVAKPNVVDLNLFAPDTWKVK